MNRIWVLCLLWIGMPQQWAAHCHGASPPPNVLLIVADDLGYSDLGCYGGEIQTPNLDQLATDGVRLTRFYNMGRCCPSRTSILTGQYPHRVGVGHKVSDLGEKHPGYRGRILSQAKTIAEILQPAGYRSFISGKWHLGTPDPTQHGFEQFYGTLVSAKTFWDADHYLRLPTGETKVNSKQPFYGTDAVTDHALNFLQRARSTPQQPWFLYLAYQAPHFPLHAKPVDIAKYKTTYSVGWDVIRQQRLQRMKALGIVPETTQLSPRSQYWNYGETVTGRNPAWETLPAARQTDLAQRMAIYAAMIDCIDQNVGRMIADLKQHQEFENTLILFLSDNGACGEWDPFGFDVSSSNHNILHQGAEFDRMGGPDSYHSVGSGWANASNTPWRLQKHFTHEGGINSPCIVHWPAGGVDRDVIQPTPTHIIDLLPTIAAAAGANPNISLPMPGENLLPLLSDPAPELLRRLQDRPLFFEHEGNRAIEVGRWKLVALRDRSNIDGDARPGATHTGQPWELYDLTTDRTEGNDLSAQHPEVVQRLENQWNAWAKENYVTPLPEDYGVDYLRSKSKSESNGLAATYRDDFGALQHPRRLLIRGKWQIDDRIARCQDTSPATSPGPTIHYDLPIQDATIRFRMRPNRDVRSCELKLKREDGTAIQLAWKQDVISIGTLDKRSKPLDSVRKASGFTPDHWTSVVVTNQGEMVTMEMDQTRLSVSHPEFEGKKSMIELSFDGGSLELKEFSVLDLVKDSTSANQ